MAVTRIEPLEKKYLIDPTKLPDTRVGEVDIVSQAIEREEPSLVYNRVYSDLYEEARNVGVTEDKIPENITAVLKDTSESDWDVFLEDLYDRGATPEEIKAVFSSIGIDEKKASDVSRLFNVASMTPEDEDALYNRVFPNLDKEAVLATAQEDTDSFIKSIQLKGRNEDTENLLTLVGLGDYVDDIFATTRRMADVGGVRQIVSIAKDGKVYNDNNQWIATYNRATKQFNRAKNDEGWFKDNIIDPWNMAANQLGHNLAQFGSGVLANILFRDLTDFERKIYGDDWVDKVNASNKELRDTFREIYAESQADFDKWVVKHPELIPKPEYAEGIRKNPSLLLDPGYFVYEFSSTAPITLGIMAVVAGGVATGNIPLATLGGIAIMTPAEASTAYDALIDAGAPEDEAANWGMFIGTTASAIETFSDLLFLKLIAAPVAGLFRKGVVKEMAKVTAGYILKKGIQRYSSTVAIEVGEELLTQAITNGVMKVYDENRDIWDGLVDTALRTFAAVTPTALITGGGTVAGLSMPQTEALRGRIKEALKGEEGFIKFGRSEDITPEQPSGEEVTPVTPEVTTHVAGRTIFTSKNQKAATDGETIFINTEASFQTEAEIDKFFADYKGTIVAKDLERARRIISNTKEGVVAHEQGHIFSASPELHQSPFMVGLTQVIREIWVAEETAVRANKPIGRPPLLSSGLTLGENLSVASEEIPQQYALYKTAPELQAKYYPEIYKLFNANKSQVGEFNLPVKEVLTKATPVTPEVTIGEIPKGFDVSFKGERVGMVNTYIPKGEDALLVQKLTIDKEGIVNKGFLQSLFTELANEARAKGLKYIDIIPRDLKIPLYNRLFSERTYSTGVNVARIEVSKITPTPPVSEAVTPTTPAVEPTTMPEGEQIANIIGVRYDGIQEGIGNQFTDPVTGTTFYAETMDEAADKLIEKRQLFAEAPSDATIKTITDKLANAIREARPAREVTEQLKHQELSRRAAMAASILAGGEGYSAFDKSKSALQGSLPEAKDYVMDLEAFEITNEDIKAMYDKIRLSNLRYFQKLHTAESLSKLLIGQIPTELELTRLEKMFGVEIIRAIQSRYTQWQKFRRGLLETLNIPRTLLATADLSATLRQGILLAFGQPVQSSKALVAELKVIFSEKNYKEIDTLVHNMVYAEKGEQHKLYLAPIEEAAGISTLEESYMGRVIERVPIIGQIVRASERAYNTFLNVQRAEVWSYWCRKWENTGKTWKDYDDLASFINHATGRGDLGALENAGAWLNAAFFAPRYLASRIQAPLDLITSTPAVRKVVARNLIAFVATGMSALALASLAGAETEDDPRSADFGKIKIGNTRIEFWGGYLPYVRFLTQVITEQRKVTKTGAMVDVDWTDVVSMFVRSKLAPIPGLVWDLKEGQTFIGEELTPENAPQILYEKLTPMFAQDLADALNDANTSTAEATAYGLMAAFGIGVQTYEDNWGSAEDNLGLPVREEGMPYTIKNPIYDTGDYYSDVGKYIGTATYDMLKDKQGISEKVLSVAQTRDIKRTLSKVLNEKLVNLNADPSKGDTYEQYYRQWQAREQLTDEKEIAQFDKDYPNAFKGNMSQRDYTLLVQYHSLTTDVAKERFLLAVPSLNVNPREQYLKDNPKENAQLVIWGQHRLLTIEAYREARKMVEQLDIPDNAVNEFLPPNEKMAEAYIVYKSLSANSKRAKMILTQNPDLARWLRGDTTVTEGAVETEPQTKAPMSEVEEFMSHFR